MLPQLTYHKRILLLGLMLLLLLIPPDEVKANQSVECDSELSELLLSFRYPSVGRVFVMGRYDYGCDRLFLPVLEMFSHLEVNRQTDRQAGEISGTFLTSGEPYKISFESSEVSVGNNRNIYPSNLMWVGDSDYYISTIIFEEMFDMEFVYNLSNLSIDLSTPHEMPVVEKSRRIAARETIQALRIERNFYPLKYGRDRSLLSAGYVDYNMGLTSQPSTGGQDFNFQFESGIEALGGQLTARNSFGHTHDGGWYRRNGNIRWKYSVRDIAAFSSLEVGQITTGGLLSQQVKGIRMTNEPVENLQLYGETVVDGSTEPNSEVELYLNNQLVDFTLSDSQGYYRFKVPLRYGSSQLRLKSYTPDGRLLENEREIRVPFSFQRKGDLTYNLQAGLLRNDGTLRAEEGEKALNADINYGLSNWLTVSAGIEYNELESRQTALYSSATARLFQRYLVNVDAAPSFFYRAQTSTILNRDQSISAAYTFYDGATRFNQTGAEHQLSGNVYTPLPFKFLNAGFRLNVDHTRFSEFDETRFQTDLFNQLGPFNIRFGYRDRLVSSDSDLSLTGGSLTGSLTYRISRRNTFKILSGSFIRSSVIYNRMSRAVQQYDFQLSRGFFGRGQLTLGFSRIVSSGQSYLQVGFNLDFKGKVRSTSRARTDFSNPAFMQTFRGSLGYDDSFDSWQTSDRQQVGKAGVSILLFVDKDGDGEYTSGDEIIPHAAVKLDRPARIELSREGVIRLSQLQANHRYNLVIDRGAIPNPLFLPAYEKFSFIADPNQFKRVEIPFYPSGVIEGVVSMLTDKQTEGVGGMRLTISGIGNEFEKTTRTFRDGSFYMLDIPSGRYEIRLDPEQLNFLNVKTAKNGYTFEIEARSDGDYIDEMRVILHPRGEMNK